MLRIGMARRQPEYSGSFEKVADMARLCTAVLPIHETTTDHLEDFA
jgi:hypothetical protein